MYAKDSHHLHAQTLLILPPCTHQDVTDGAE